ncbi:DinB family protein [Roseobacteraceae bacterium NS-SX3]
MPDPADGRAYPLPGQACDGYAERIAAVEHSGLRSKRDEEIEEWAARLVDADLDGTVVWYAGDGSTRFEKPKTLCAAELFNHQTHHRGQVHAMLTAAGAEPEPTILSMLP